MRPGEIMSCSSMETEALLICKPLITVNARIQSTHFVHQTTFKVLCIALFAAPGTRMAEAR